MINGLPVSWHLMALSCCMALPCQSTADASISIELARKVSLDWLLGIGVGGKWLGCEYKCTLDVNIQESWEEVHVRSYKIKMFVLR